MLGNKNTQHNIQYEKTTQYLSIISSQDKIAHRCTSKNWIMFYLTIYTENFV